MTLEDNSVETIKVLGEVMFLNTRNTPALTWSLRVYYCERKGSLKTSYHINSTYAGVSYHLLGY